MELAGKVINILPEQSGQGKNGTWRKQEFILETEGQYPKKVCVTLWGDRIDQYGLKEGDMVNASIDIESREYNGRWYTDVKAWKVDKQTGGQSPSEAPYPQSDDYAPPSTPPMPDEEDDLPF